MNKLLKFYSPTCTPCKVLSNFLNDKEVVYEDIDITVQQEYIDKYGLSSVPVLILLDENEQEIDRAVGFNPDATEELLTKMK